MLKGAIVFNKYYTDSGLEYIESRLRAVFLQNKVQLDKITSYAVDDNNKKNLDYDFALFFDKDLALAYRLQSQGVRIFNSPDTISLCDDKEKTFSAIKNTEGTLLPLTIYSPLMYDVSNNTDTEFLKFVCKKIDYPIIIKQRVGSQGRQVYLAEDFDNLNRLYQNLKHIPHLYQQFIKSQDSGDIRVYIIGKRSVFAAMRKNTTDFRSNVFFGGEMTAYNLSQRLKSAADNIAKQLDLEYGSADFIKSGNDYYFIEANSNVYMKAAEDLGANLAEKYADYVLDELAAKIRGLK